MISNLTMSVLNKKLKLYAVGKVQHAERMGNKDVMGVTNIYLRSNICTFTNARVFLYAL